MEQRLSLELPIASETEKSKTWKVDNKLFSFNNTVVQSISHHFHRQGKRESVAGIWTRENWVKPRHLTKLDDNGLLQYDGLNIWMNSTKFLWWQISCLFFIVKSSFIYNSKRSVIFTWNYGIRISHYPKSLGKLISTHTLFRSALFVW